ncbi:MAG: winged helix-turn-helix transcriptional regulator [Ardenticatenaceae bacterium]|nr:winged helix-turn-helix transcriptional regulator [Ardenticatenaceae bacterium]
MQTPTLLWDIGAAYDMFISLNVLHAPDRFGLRGAWAAGVRSRLPNAEREALQRIIPAMNTPLHWLYALPSPKDGATVLQAVTAVPPADRLRTIAKVPYMPPQTFEILENVAARGGWQAADLTQLQAVYQEHWGEKLSGREVKERATCALEMWARPLAFGEGLLAGLQAYQEVFFAEEELRIRPALEAALKRAQQLADRLPLPALIEELSQGVRLTKEFDMEELVLTPSFWGDPLMIFGNIGPGRDIVVFGGRPSDASLVPGAVVPDALFQTLKALADPTRLRILRYLSEEPLTPAELARRLRLRAPTVVHHLHTLRLARLVQLTVEPEGKRYQARREAVDEACHLLSMYLDKEVEVE